MSPLIDPTCLPASTRRARRSSTTSSRSTSSPGSSNGTRLTASLHRHGAERDCAVPQARGRQSGSQRARLALAVQHEVLGGVQSPVRARSSGFYSGHRQGICSFEIPRVHAPLDGAGKGGRDKIRPARMRWRRLLAGLLEVHDGVSMEGT
eukprot:1889388-Rhodomonas_salina.1